MASQDGRSVIRFPRSVWALLLLWLGVTAGAVVWGVPHQEEHLTGVATRALAGSTLTASFEGRDAVLAGSVAAEIELERAKTAVLTQHGVRRVGAGDVTVVDTGAEPEREGEATAALVIRVDGRSLTIEGIVPDPATDDAIATAAADLFGDGNVASDLDIEPSVAGVGWLRDFPAILEALGRLPSGTLTLDANTATIEGRVASGELRTQLVDELAGVLSADIAVVDRLEVVVGVPPSLSAAFADEVVVMGGTMPTQEVIDAIEGSATLAFGVESVQSELAVGEVTSPDYLTPLPGLVPALRHLTRWEATLDADRVEVSGFGLTESALADASTAVADLWQGSVDLELVFELDATNVATTLTELLQGGTNFEVGSARLSAEATEKLDRAIELLVDNPTTRLTVEGHTDDVGSEAANLELSQERAQAVVDYLVAGGIDSDRLEAVGFGESDPIASNDTAAGQAANRRIEFVLTEGDQ